MKKLMMAVAGALILAGCNQEEEVAEPATDGTTEVRFSINELDVTTEPMSTRTTVTDANMTDLWLLAYSADTLAAQVHQSATDAAFGTFSLKLKHGTYSFYVVASRGVSPVLDTTAQTITWGSVRDTFMASLSLNVQPKSGGTKNVVLNRCVGRLKIAATDVVPDNAAKFTITPSTWYYGLNYATGAATASASSTIAVNIPSSYIGTQNLIVSVYTISGSEAWQTDVTAALLAGDESVIGSVTIQNVPIHTNHITSYQGGIVGAGRNINITGDDEWVEDEPVNW